MANFLTTLKNKSKTNTYFPRTVLKAVGDDNGGFLDNQLVASDINILKNGKISQMSSALEDTVSGPASSSANNIVTFSGTTGKTVSDSGMKVVKTTEGDDTIYTLTFA